MAVDFDGELTDLAALILTDAAQVYNLSEDETWLSGYNPVLTAWKAGMFGRLEMARPLQAATDPPQATAGTVRAAGRDGGAGGRTSIRRLFRLPDRLPAVRLPLPPELAALARSAPLMVKLDKLARWLGHDGRPVTRDHLLLDVDAADAIERLDVRSSLLPYLWEHALVTGWLEVVDGPDRRRSWVVVGKTAYRWADGDVLGTLHVWAAVFASVLARTLEVTADQAPEAARQLNFQGQGLALAVILFLSRRTGLTMGDVQDIVQDGAIGDPPTGRAKKAWDAWGRQFGDPARTLLRELAALRAVVLPSQDGGVLALSPLAQWALREQFMLDDIDTPVIPASGELSAADLVEFADMVSDTEFNAEFEAWLSRRNPGRAARDLLMYASSTDAKARLTTVDLVRRIGTAAGGAWVEAMESPQLRGYAHIALAMLEADLPKPRPPSIRKPNPDDLDWVAADLLSLIGEYDDPDPKRIAMHFREAIPAGKEGWFFQLLSRAARPDTGKVLELLGRYHPDRNVARDARKAARVAARNRPPARQDPIQDDGVSAVGPESRLGPRAMPRA